MARHRAERRAIRAGYGGAGVNMYMSMDNIGFENEGKIKTIDSESKRWQFIYDIAKVYGFEGIHVTPPMYDSLGLDLNNIPDYLQDFRLTLHYGGHHKFASEEEYSAFDEKFSRIFEIALKHNMHDISLHPPLDNANGFSPDEKKICEGWFDKIISKWLKEASRSNISLSLETHVTGRFFLFDGLHEYAKFIGKHPELGVLIDISHNYYDGFSEDDIISILGDKNVTALHISDAIQGAGFREGTHLAVGDGTVDFAKLLNHFKANPNLVGVLEIKAGNEGIGGSLDKLKGLLKGLEGE